MKTLRDIMRSGFPFTVQKQAMVSDAIRMMADHNVGIVIVLDGSRLAGFFSERDVVPRVLHQGLEPATTPLGEVMTRYVITADAEMDYESAMRSMDDAGIRHLLVTSGSRMLPMISVRDLMRAGPSGPGARGPAPARVPLPGAGGGSRAAGLRLADCDALRQRLRCARSER